MCQNPFGGIGGGVLRRAGWGRSRKNPNLCARCCDSLPIGGANVDIGVVFADVRGSTKLGEGVGADVFAGLMNRFYKVTTELLVRHDAIIDKLIGDEVMALFIPGIAGPSYRRRAVEAAVNLVRAVGSERATAGLTVGAAVHAGVAYVGNVGGEGVVDFTALGDTVNVAARLQEHAGAGEVVCSEDVFANVQGEFPQAREQLLDLRGRNVAVRTFTISTTLR